MNNKAVALSLAMAVVAVFFVNSYVSSIEENARKKYGTEVLVLVARSDVREMESITDAHLERKAIPKSFLEPSAVWFAEEQKDEEQAKKDLRRLIGSVAIVPIKQGEQITYNKITEPGIRTGLAPQVAPGKRAVSVPINESTGVSKLVKPGDRVDLIAVVTPGSSRDHSFAKTVLQDVAVLAVGRNVTNNIARTVDYDTFNNKPKINNLNLDSNFSSVTLEVDTQQAQLISLILANPQNTLSLSLRNNDDSERQALAPSTLADVVTERRQPASR